MKKSTFCLVVFACLFATVAQAQIPRVTKVNPRIINGPGINNPGNILGGCEDPAIVDFKVDRIGGNVRAQVVVKNIGMHHFVSGPNQQLVQIYRNGTMVASRSFPGNRLNAGAVLTLDYSGVFAANTEWKAFIVYDPDIYIDGNTQNDDCNQGNNTQTR